MKSIIRTTLSSAIVAFLFAACTKDPVTPAATIVKEWTVPLSAKYENPAPAGRPEAGNVVIQLLSDNSLKYAITVTGLTAGDALTAAHIHTGNAVTNGSVILGFNPVFTGSTAAGTIANVRTTFIDSLKDDDNQLYFNVHSTQAPGGLIRGQVNEDIEFADDIVMSGANETPNPVTTTATGIALLRITSAKSQKVLYSKVSVSNLEAGDVLTAAHIHSAAIGVNGPVIVPLCAGAADFGTVKVTTLTDVIYNTIKTGDTYANAHSTNHPAGIIRGQVKHS
ncbi:MAG: CHRD domain-containing protein [Ferruginibacter sp.]